MKQVISASRRTDIPAFHTEWLMKRLGEKFVYVKNPYNGKAYRVSLEPPDIHSIVFWSKNFSPLIGRLPEIERTTRNLFFHFTITGAPKSIERHTPPVDQALSDLEYLSERYSPGHVVWRFDPIVAGAGLTFDHIEEVFRRCAERVRGKVLACYTSFMHPYVKVVRRFAQEGPGFIDPPVSEKRAFAERLAQTAHGYGITLRSCCNEFLLTQEVGKAACIDGNYLSALFDDFSAIIEGTPTRKGCNCTRSVDIGAYDTCGHGCLYCYASGSSKDPLGSAKDLDPNSNGLGFHIDGRAEGQEEQAGLGAVQPGLFIR